MAGQGAVRGVWALLAAMWLSPAAGTAGVAATAEEGAEAEGNAAQIEARQAQRMSPAQLAALLGPAAVRGALAAAGGWRPPCPPPAHELEAMMRRELARNGAARTARRVQTQVQHTQVANALPREKTWCARD